MHRTLLPAVVAASLILLHGEHLQLSRNQLTVYSQYGATVDIAEKTVHIISCEHRHLYV